MTTDVAVELITKTTFCCLIWRVLLRSWFTQDGMLRRLLFRAVLLRLCTPAVQKAAERKNMITPDTDAVMDGSLVIRLELQKRILPGPIDAMFWGENI